MSARFELVQGDITKQEVDAIVNAANTGLVGGGGVDGAIHRAGGPESHVIHTAGPRWHGGDRNEREQLASCYRSCLELAERHGLRTIAFPSISTGVYGYPVEDAARVALMTVRRYLDRHPDAFDLVRFVLFSDSDLRTYQRVLAEQLSAAG